MDITSNKRVLACAAALVIAAAGCSQFRGARVVEGVNLEAGLSIPGTDATLSMVSYTSGFKAEAATNCTLVATNYVNESNSYLWGLVTTSRSNETVTAISPCGLKQ